nr:hypothetical protein [uncultured Desulfuromonas sp.]
MKNVILTESNRERLKILSFLFQVSGWSNQVIEDLDDAIDRYQQLTEIDPFSVVLVVVDYEQLGQRFEKLEKLAVIAPVPDSIILSAHHWSDERLIELNEAVPQCDSFVMCHAHQLMDAVEQYRRFNVSQQPFCQASLS